MASVYFVKDGPRPANSGPAVKTISVVDLESTFTEMTVLHLGASPPEFNRSNPSMYAEHVVVEVESSESLGKIFDRSGFFVIKDLKPAQAAELLK